MEEEEHDRCDGADPRRRLDNAHLSLADVILLRLIVVTTAGAAAMAVRCMATVTMLMPAIDVVAVHWAGGLGGQQRQQRHDRGQQRCQREIGRVHMQFFVGPAKPTLRGAFQEDDTNDDDDRDN